KSIGGTLSVGRLTRFWIDAGLFALKNTIYDVFLCLFYILIRTILTFVVIEKLVESVLKIATISRRNRLFCVLRCTRLCPKRIINVCIGIFSNCIHQRGRLFYSRIVVKNFLQFWCNVIDSFYMLSVYLLRGGRDPINCRGEIICSANSWPYEILYSTPNSLKILISIARRFARTTQLLYRNPCVK